MLSVGEHKKQLGRVMKVGDQKGKDSEIICRLFRQLQTFIFCPPFIPCPTFTLSLPDSAVCSVQCVVYSM